MTSEEALQKLKDGNRSWLKTGRTGDLTEDSVRVRVSGQSPYAAVIACSDSRVIPEAIFGAGTGELFVIRTAGNTIGDEAMGSIEYAVDHLGTRLVIVLGHTHCGAVGATLAGQSGEYIRHIVSHISKAIGQEKDPYQASCLNVRQAVSEVKDNLAALDKNCFRETMVCGAIFDIEDGSVSWLDPEE